MRPMPRRQEDCHEEIQVPARRGVGERGRRRRGTARRPPRVRGEPAHQPRLRERLAVGLVVHRWYLHGWYGTGTYNADDVSLDGPGGAPGVPGAPGTPAVGTVTNTSVALSWGASSGTVSGYRVFDGGNVVATPTGTSATVSGLAACSSHTFSVAAFNAAGESPKSSPVTVTTTGCGTGVPGTPGTPTVGTVTNSSLALSWTAASGTVSGYRVFDGGNVVATPTGTSATVSGLAACSSHTFTVAAFNAAGESPKSSPVTVTTTGCGTGVPGTPGTPTVGTVTSSSVALSWSAASGTVSGYRVFDGGNVVATPTGTSATVSGLAACSSHTFTVAAFNSTGESPKSGAASATTTGCTTSGPA